MNDPIGQLSWYYLRPRPLWLRLLTFNWETHEKVYVIGPTHQFDVADPLDDWLDTQPLEHEVQATARIWDKHEMVEVLRRDPHQMTREQLIQHMADIASIVHQTKEAP